MRSLLSTQDYHVETMSVHLSVTSNR